MNNAKKEKRRKMTLSPTLKDLENNGLIANNGVIMGKYRGKYISDPTFRSVMMYFPFAHGK
ncbi:MAG: hypothetical protein LBP39_00760 [Rickettsiales bacterium]|nr:hypothetical protein [Rickettsiales bacterium]